MKKIILAAAVLSMASTMAFAGADAAFKDAPSNSQGSGVGIASSQITGNGGVVGGNGTSSYGANPADQTTSPGSRSDAVHAINGTPPGQAKK